LPDSAEGSPLSSLSAEGVSQLFTIVAGGNRQLLQPSIFGCVIFFTPQRKSFAGWTHGIFWHADPRWNLEKVILLKALDQGNFYRSENRNDQG
jgi:hypothetical protein